MKLDSFSQAMNSHTFGEKMLSVMNAFSTWSSHSLHSCNRSQTRMLRRPRIFHATVALTVGCWALSTPQRESRGDASGTVRRSAVNDVGTTAGTAEQRSSAIRGPGAKPRFVGVATSPETEMPSPPTVREWGKRGSQRLTKPPPVGDGMVRMLNEVLTFDWPNTPNGFGPYTSMNTDHGSMGAGPDHWSLIDDGALHVVVGADSWEGRWISLRGLSAEEDLTLDASDPMPRAIRAAHRLRVVAIRVRGKGQGQYRVELAGDDDVLHWSEHAIDRAEYGDEYTILPPSLPGCRSLNIVVDAPTAGSGLFFDRVDLSAIP
jgi:hypothetical protein